MKNILLFLTLIFLAALNGFAQSDIKMQTEYGAENADLLSVLRFENIGLYKLNFSGGDLKGKHFQISVKQYRNGKLIKTDIAFDSKESDYFRIKNNKFTFRVLTKITSDQTAKFNFVFDGFSSEREYKVGKSDKEFAQKDFLGTSREASVPLNTNTYK